MTECNMCGKRGDARSMRMCGLCGSTMCDDCMEAGSGICDGCVDDE
ncbi:MAG: hypothetical protein ACOYI5_01670 [Christensenellales bacterium]|jgi:hypothetical protein